MMRWYGFRWDEVREVFLKNISKTFLLTRKGNAETTFQEMWSFRPPFHLPWNRTSVKEHLLGLIQSLREQTLCFSLNAIWLNYTFSRAVFKSCGFFFLFLHDFCKKMSHIYWYIRKDLPLNVSAVFKLVSSRVSGRLVVPRVFDS